MRPAVAAILCLALVTACAAKRSPRYVAGPPVQGTCLPIVSLRVTQEYKRKSEVFFELRAADGVAILDGPWMRVSGDVVEDVYYHHHMRCDGRLVSGLGASAQFDENDRLIVHRRYGEPIRFTVTDEGRVIMDDPRGPDAYATTSLPEMQTFWAVADGLRVHGDVRRGRRTVSLLIARALVQ